MNKKQIERARKIHARNLKKRWQIRGTFNDGTVQRFAVDRDAMSNTMALSEIGLMSAIVHDQKKGRFYRFEVLS